MISSRLQDVLEDGIREALFRNRHEVLEGSGAISLIL